MCKKGSNVPTMCTDNQYKWTSWYLISCSSFLSHAVQRAHHHKDNIRVVRLRGRTETRCFQSVCVLIFEKPAGGRKKNIAEIIVIMSISTLRLFGWSLVDVVLRCFNRGRNKLHWKQVSKTKRPLADLFLPATAKLLTSGCGMFSAQETACASKTTNKIKLLVPFT